MANAAPLIRRPGHVSAASSERHTPATSSAAPQFSEANRPWTVGVIQKKKETDNATSFRVGLVTPRRARTQSSSDIQSASRVDATRSANAIENGEIPIASPSR